MRLIIRDLVKKIGEDTLLNEASYTFWPGKVYGLIGDNTAAKKTFLDCINFETVYDEGTIELICAGKNCMKPLMIAQLLEEPAFPEFLTAAEFLKYFMDINKKDIVEQKTPEEYLEEAEISKKTQAKLIKDYTYNEKIQLQFVCFLICTPPVLIVNEIRNIGKVEFLENIKKYLDIIKKDSIVLMDVKDEGTMNFLCDEWLTIDNGNIRGGI